MNLHSGRLGEGESQPAPSAPDVQNLLPRFEQKFRGQVALLGELGALQGQAVLSEVGAGILEVLIEDSAIELDREILVVGHVAAGLMSRVAL